MELLGSGCGSRVKGEDGPGQRPAGRPSGNDGRWHSQVEILEKQRSIGNGSGGLQSRGEQGTLFAGMRDLGHEALGEDPWGRNGGGGLTAQGGGQHLHHGPPPLCQVWAAMSARTPPASTR